MRFRPIHTVTCGGTGGCHKMFYPRFRSFRVTWKKNWAEGIQIQSTEDRALLSDT